MAEIINLNKFRKAKAKSEGKARADQNAVKYGRTQAEKLRDQADADKAKREFDGHERET